MLSTAPNPPSHTQLSRLLDRLPWEKVLIWGLILLAIHTLRHLFFIIFMTFLFSFFIRTVVVAVASRIPPRRERPWLERGLTLATFVVMLTGVTSVFRYIGPKIYEQSRALVLRLQGTDPQEAIRDLRNRTVGAYLLRRRLGQPGDEVYDNEFKAFRQEGHVGKSYFSDFPALRDGLQTRFEGTEAARKLRVRERTDAGTLAAGDFDGWFLEHKAPRILEEKANRERYEARWSEDYSKKHGAAALLRLSPDDRSRIDDEIKRDFILQDLKDNPAEYRTTFDGWQQGTVSRRLQELLALPEYEESFKEFYEAWAGKPGSYPFDFETFKKLNAAYPDELRFIELITAHAVGREDADPDVLARDFRLTQQAHLAEQWWNEDPVAVWIQTQVREDLPIWFDRLRQWVQTVIGYAARLPLELATALILTIFITFDVPRLRQGVHRLHRTRLKDVYEEIAPGLVAFSRLIGRAFEAQAVIALFNTMLTFAVLWFLGIENAIFLCTLVFLCSFIPILGVIFSSVPIALLAILQPGGSLWLAMQAVIGIIIIHFIETSILNPKILGDMLHLHPVMVLGILLIGEHFFGIWGLLLGVPVGVFIFRIVLLNEQIPGITDRPAALPEASPSRLGVTPAPQTSAEC